MGTKSKFGKLGKVFGDLIHNFPGSIQDRDTYQMLVRVRLPHVKSYLMPWCVLCVCLPFAHFVTVLHLHILSSIDVTSKYLFIYP